MTIAIDLADAARNGAYLVTAADLEALAATARARGYLARGIDLDGCRDKPELLRRITAALEFPATFGDNWDALSDCLRDLAWLPHAHGYVWLFSRAAALRAAAPSDFDTLRAVLCGACAAWRAAGTPCFAFLAVDRAATHPT